MFVNEESTETTAPSTSTPAESSAATVVAASPDQPATPPPLPGLPEGIRLLLGHVDAETGYLQPDYPYGWELRCTRRVWVETKKRYGQRAVFQTSNPKKTYLHWNKPKAGQYSEIVVLTIDEREGEKKGHIETHHLGSHQDEAAIDAFIAKYGPALLGEYERKTIDVLRAYARAQKRITYTIVPASSTEPRQTMPEQARILGGIARQELASITSAT